MDGVDLLSFLKRFLGSIWKGTGKTQGLMSRINEGCCILHWNFLRDLVDSGSCRLFVV